MSPILKTPALLAAFALLTLGNFVSAAVPNGPGEGNWPGFLGAGASPIDESSIPVEWSPDKNIAWKAKIVGDGQSSPVIWQETVYVTSVTGEMKDQLHISAYDLQSGELKWKKGFDTSFKVESTLYVSRAAPTVVADESGLIAYFESGDVIALGHDGTLRWQRSLSRDYGEPKNKFGLSASPVQTHDSVVVLVDDEGPSYLVALKKADGEVLWKQDRTSRVSWSSPALVRVGDRELIVVSSAGSVDGYAAESGELLWSQGDLGGNTSSTPMPYGDGLFLVGASAGREGENAALSKKSNLAMQVTIKEGKAEPTVLWRNDTVSPSFGSPMVYQGLAYWVNRVGVVFCLDAKTGEQKFTQRLKQSIWATPLGIGDRVYFFGKDGLTTVMATGPEAKVLAENMLWGEEDASPETKIAAGDSEEQKRGAKMFGGRVQYGVAAVSGSLLIRTGDRLYCVRKQSE